MSQFDEVSTDYAVDIDKVPLKSTTNNEDFQEYTPQERGPTPLSLNPMDWYRDIKREYQEFTWGMTEKRRVLLRAVFGEGLVTFLFLFIVMAAAVNNGRQENPENLVLSCICTAFTAVALIYSFADVSGAHFNPAVTFATMVTGKVSLTKGLAYIFIQIIASVLATGYIMAVFPKDPREEHGYNAMAKALVVSLDPTVKIANAFFMEMTLSFILIYVIFATAFDTVDTTNQVKVDSSEKSDSSVGRKLTIYTTSGNSKAGFAPIAIGFTLGFLGLLGGSVSGGAFNPARAFGPALISGTWDNHWIYWVGDFLGAALAGWMQSNFAHKAVTHSAAVGTNKVAKK